jgi:mono/diheme cytochrome c family protein
MKPGNFRIFRILVATLLWVSVAGCAEHHFEPPDRDTQVAQADSGFVPAAFDSIDWADGEERGLAGNVVYSTYCRNCHGPLGRGDTEYARTRNLTVPSMVTPDWALAQAPDSALHRIFIGHAQGMPTWGVAGLTKREMDAVTYYVLNVLRPEVLGG